MSSRRSSALLTSPPSPNLASVAAMARQLANTLPSAKLSRVTCPAHVCRRASNTHARARAFVSNTQTHTHARASNEEQWQPKKRRRRTWVAAVRHPVQEYTVCAKRGSTTLLARVRVVNNFFSPSNFTCHRQLRAFHARGDEEGWLVNL